MDVERALHYCRAKHGASEGCPFGPGTLVFKVRGKMFALANLDASPARINLKCDPGFAETLRARYRGVLPGYHQNKRHWNTVHLESDVESDMVRELIDHSYALVVAGLRKADREALTRVTASDAIFPHECAD